MITLHNILHTYIYGVCIGMYTHVQHVYMVHPGTMEMGPKWGQIS